MLAADKIFHVEKSDGTEIFSYAPAKKYQSVAFSLPTLQKGTYTIVTGGSHSGTNKNGLFTDGTYSAGTNYKKFHYFEYNYHHW